jgi:ADP-ribose pyrophosphatase YjhB (NUDIX family)
MSAAGATSPAQPVLAVGGVVFDDAGRLLVIERGRPPGVGLITIPGGKVELGETLAAACAREVREETGLEVEVGPLVEVVEKIARASDGAVAYHFVIADYLCRPIGGALAAGGDAAAARFVTRADLDRLSVTEALRPVVDRAWAMARGGSP